MSKGETAKQYAAEQTEEARSAARTEAEHQRDLTELIERLQWHVEPLAQSMATLTEQTRQAVAEQERHQAAARKKLERQVAQLRDQVATVEGTVGKLERVANRVQTPTWRLIVWPGVGAMIAWALSPLLRVILEPAYAALWSVL